MQTTLRRTRKHSLCRLAGLITARLWVAPKTFCGRRSPNRHRRLLHLPTGLKGAPPKQSAYCGTRTARFVICRLNIPDQDYHSRSRQSFQHAGWHVPSSTTRRTCCLTATTATKLSVRAARPPTLIFPRSRNAASVIKREDRRVRPRKVVASSAIAITIGAKSAE